MSSRLTSPLFADFSVSISELASRLVNATSGLLNEHLGGQRFHSPHPQPLDLTGQLADVFDLLGGRVVSVSVGSIAVGAMGRGRCRWVGCRRRRWRRRVRFAHGCHLGRGDTLLPRQFGGDRLVARRVRMPHVPLKGIEVLGQQTGVQFDFDMATGSQGTVIGQTEFLGLTDVEFEGHGVTPKGS